MFAYLKKLLFIPSITTIILFCSCNKDRGKNDYKAYFGGEIINPNSKFVYLCKDDKVIDTITLDNQNMFHKQFDSLTPGMYTFKHEPEYQYIYFEKNDSLMIRLNTSEFDNSLTFCGRGDEKNNFLIDLFLKNEEDKSNSFGIYDKDYKTFSTTIDKSFNDKKAFYARRKADLNWSDDFDLYAKTMLEMPYLAKKEMYPYVHKNRTNEDVCKKLPKNFYDFRKEINFNNEKLTSFTPFLHYLRTMLENICVEDSPNSPLENNIKKLNVTDSIFSNVTIKNGMLNKIAFMYLLEDQNMTNNKKFFDRYLELSTDKEKQKEIKQIREATQLIVSGNRLPNVVLIDKLGKSINIEDLFKSNTVIFFWTSGAKSHLEMSHKKIIELKSKYPNWNFIAINIDDTTEKWHKLLSQYTFKNTFELHALDFKDIKSKWVITKIHRAMLINKGGTIKNAFVNIFDADFENNLK
jgi:hypothetical protein